MLSGAARLPPSPRPGQGAPGDRRGQQGDDLDCDDLEWERGKAWAFEQAMGAVRYDAESNPAMS